MEFLFKRHFWIVHLAFLSGVALLVARTANGFVESSLMPLPSPRPMARVAVAEVPATLDFERLAKVTGLPGKIEPKEVVEPSAPSADLSSAPVHTTLNVKLLGTMVAEGFAEWSICSVQDVATLKVGTYRKDDEIQGAKVLEIERKRVIILHNNRREFIDETPGSGGPVAAMPIAPPIAVAKAVNDGPPPSSNLGAGIKQLGENDYDIPRAEIDKTLSNLNDVAMQARIVPAFKDGVAQGFKLFSIRPDSIYSKIGIQNGDVIKRINGYEMNSPEKALEIYSKLKEASRIDIEVERNGAAVRKTYNVRQ